MHAWDQILALLLSPCMSLSKLFNHCNLRFPEYQPHGGVVRTKIYHNSYWPCDKCFTCILYTLYLYTLPPLILLVTL